MKTCQHPIGISATHTKIKLTLGLTPFMSILKKASTGECLERALVGSSKLLQPLRKSMWRFPEITKNRTTLWILLHSGPYTQGHTSAYPCTALVSVVRSQNQQMSQQRKHGMHPTEFGSAPENRMCNSQEDWWSRGNHIK